ncbi:MAG: BON domain-containing protein [Alphaproteobacteria bacterium]|nr:BON domain-containing protein [Alphaproteobacteria bacterium]OJV13842.1 MAG: hypothetical protein BGO27_08085 [Alphaproteobacteria bacterium 33-17]
MLKLISLLFAVITLSGCFGLVAATSATTGVVLNKDKTVGSSVDDFAIRTKIHNDLLRKDINSLFSRVNVKVSEGKVLLTGVVRNPEDRMEAVRIAWNQNGVREVINEIEVDDRDRFNIGEYSKDTWITTNIKTKLLFNQNIKSVNFNIETIKGVVYIIGIARTPKELELVNSVASRVRFVKKVISHVKIKDRLNDTPEQVEYNRDHNGVVDTTYKNHKIEPIKSREISAPVNSRPISAPVSSRTGMPVDESGIVEEFDSFDD